MTHRSPLLRSVFAALLLLVPLTSVQAQAYQITERKEQIRAAMLAGGVYAEGSYYECINSNYRKGVTLAEILEVCGIRMDDDRLQGYGGDLVKETVSQAGGVDSFDPQQVQGACAAGDPTLSQGKGDSRPLLSRHSAGSLADGRSSTGVPTLRGEPLLLVDGVSGKPMKVDGQYVPLFDGYTSGGAGSVKTDAKGVVLGSYKGLSESESKALKEQAIAAYSAAKKKFDNGEITYSELEAAAAEAAKDPNFVPKGNSRTADEDSLCGAVLTSARETLRECNRTGWKPTQCQQLHAKINACPDPTRIYVDPEAGYECGATIDAKLVIDAWVAGCRSVTTPGPDGSDPCAPPQINDSGQIAWSDKTDLCHNPKAYIDEEAAGCIGVLTVDNPVDQSISEIILYALDRFGGPTVVLPLRNPPPPGVGPEPMPGPK